MSVNPIKVSILIPILNAESFLPKLIQLFLEKPQDWEVCFLDSESDDQSASMIDAAGLKRVSLPRNQFQHGKARNILSQHSQGQVLVFMTQDALPQSIQDIKALIEPIVEHKAQACYGRQVPLEGADVLETLHRQLQYNENDCLKSLDEPKDLGIKRYYFSNSFSAIERNVFEELDGFKEDLIVNEDMEFAYRLIHKGYRLQYVADAKCWHSHDYSLAERFGRYFDVGVFLKSHPYISREAIGGTGGGLAKKALLGPKPAGSRGNKAMSFLQLGFSLFGYRLGCFYRFLPKGLCCAISRQKNYWRKS